MALDKILPYEFWESQILETSIVFNKNALRDQIFESKVISSTTSNQPLNPSDGDVYILTVSPSGNAWSYFDPLDIVIYRDGSWFSFSPVNNVRLRFGSGYKVYDSSTNSWKDESGGGGGGGNPDGTLSVTFDAGSGKVKILSYGDDIVPFDCNIVGWNIISESMGSCKIEVYSNESFSLIESTPITSNSKPFLLNQQINSDTILDGWIKSLSKGDYIRYRILESENISRVRLVIRIEKV